MATRFPTRSALGRTSLFGGSVPRDPITNGAWHLDIEQRAGGDAHSVGTALCQSRTAWRRSLLLQRGNGTQRGMAVSLLIESSLSRTDMLGGNVPRARSTSGAPVWQIAGGSTPDVRSVRARG